MSEERGLEALGVPADRSSIYELALTHRSYAFEQQDGEVEHNERLEFLGDSVLGVVVTKLIYDRYPESTEGDLARLRASVVNTNALASLASSLGIGESMRLGRGEEASGGRAKASLLADTFEAVVGAVYLDRGLDVVASQLEPLFVPLLEESIASGRYDAKTALQEIAVRESGELPAYRVDSTGPDHDKRFTAYVFIDDERFGVGAGRSKKEAEQNAAREALARIEKRSEEDETDA